MHRQAPSSSLPSPVTHHCCQSSNNPAMPPKAANVGHDTAALPVLTSDRTPASQDFLELSQQKATSEGKPPGQLQLRI
jgi:hypothetical protein